jgi:nitronate monooxygenase
LSLSTRICELFGVEHPVLNAPMGGGDAPAALAAAVSEAWGLGMIGGTTAGGVGWLRDEIRTARQLTEKPFGVGVITHLPGASELMAVALDEGVRVVALSFGDPTPYVEPAHAAGAIVVCQVRTVGEALRAAAAGVDAVTAQGTEAGGHTGSTATLPLVPAVVDAVSPLPVIAAGGIGDGRGIAAALVLGAEGVWIGTAFLATAEAGVPSSYKRRVLDSGTDDTVLTTVFDLAMGIPWPDGVAGRSLRNQFTEQWHGKEEELRVWAHAHRDELRAMSDDPETMPLYAGPAAQFVVQPESAGEVVRRLVSEAVAVLRSRPPLVLATTRPAPADEGGDPPCWAHLAEGPSVD